MVSHLIIPQMGVWDAKPDSVSFVSKEDTLFWCFSKARNYSVPSNLPPFREEVVDKLVKSKDNAEE